MTPSRRSFLRKAAMFAVTTSASIRAFSEGQERELTDSEQFGIQTLASDPQQTFERWTGGIFRVSWRGKRLGTVVLASVESKDYPQMQPIYFPQPLPQQPRLGAPRGAAVPMGPRVAELRATYLEFDRPRGYLPQETYTLSHDWLGTFNLLLVPKVPYSGAITYVATFARLTGKWVGWSST